MKRCLAVLTLLILAGLCACDIDESPPPASPTPVLALAPSPTSTPTATPTNTPSPSPTLTPTREPTMTRWPTYTASPTRPPTQTSIPTATKPPTRTPSPTPTPVVAENVAPVGHADGPAHVICVQGHYAYMGAGTSLVVLDVSDPAHPQTAGSIMLPHTVLDVCVAGSPSTSFAKHPERSEWTGQAHAYVAAGPRGLYVVDVSNPANPTLVGVYDALECAYAVAVQDHRVYVAAGSGGLHVVDVTNPASPALLGTHPIPGAWTHDVTVAGRYAYVASYVFDVDQVRWQVVDVTDPAAPVVVGTHDLPGWAWGAAVAGDRAYVADGRRGGLRTLDVRDPAAPIEMGFTHTWERRVYDVAVMGVYACVAAGPEGLRVLDVSNPAAMVEVGHYDTPGDAVGVAAANGLVYVADGVGGLEILRVAPAPMPPTPTPRPLYTPAVAPRQVTISPDEIEARLRQDREAALPAIWRELGMDLDTLPQVNQVYEIERQDIQLGASTYVLLRLDERRGSWCNHFLFFVSQGAGWRFLGLIDLCQHYDMGKHRIVTIGEQGIWCVVPRLMASGTELIRHDDLWFKIDETGVWPALQYPANGHNLLLTSPYLIMLYESQVVSPAQVDGIYTVDVQLTTSFSDGRWTMAGDLFSTTRQAYYVWDPLARQFFLDQTRSEISQKELDDHDELDWWSREELIRRYFEELVQITGDEREWLTSYLRDSRFYGLFEDIPEKRALLAMLNLAPRGVILDPSNLGGKAQDVAVMGTQAYVAAGEGGLRVVDVSNPTAPVVVGYYNTLDRWSELGYGSSLGGAQGVALADAERPHVYVADAETSLWIVDVSRPTTPNRVGSFHRRLWETVDVAAGGQNIYVVADDMWMPISTLWIVDASNPAAPVEVGVYHAPCDIRDVAAIEPYVYIASTKGLEILNISNPEVPTVVGSYDLQGMGASAVEVVGHYAYVTDYFGALGVVDISDPTAPTEIGSCPISGHASGIIVAGNYAYVAAGENGLRVIDVSDPTMPVEVGFYVVPGGEAKRVAVARVASSGRLYAYVAAGVKGLRVIDVTDPTAPVEVGFCEEQAP